MGPVKDDLSSDRKIKQCWSLLADGLRGFVAPNRSRWVYRGFTAQQIHNGKCKVSSAIETR